MSKLEKLIGNMAITLMFILAAASGWAIADAVYLCK